MSRDRQDRGNRFIVGMGMSWCRVQRGEGTQAVDALAGATAAKATCTGVQGRADSLSFSLLVRRRFGKSIALGSLRGWTGVTPGS